MTTTLTPRRERRRLSFDAGFETRAMPGDRIAIRGYAAVYDQVAYGEVVRKGAFDKTVAEADDVRFLVNHDGVPIARTKSGTCTLSLDDRGLVVDAPDLDRSNPTVAELVSAMSRGDIDQMSFAFTEIRSADTVDPETGVEVCELLEVRLWDVSVVTYPWYDETEAGLEGLDRALRHLHDGKPLTPEERALILARAGDIAEPEPTSEPETPARRGVTAADLDALWDVA